VVPCRGFSLAIVYRGDPVVVIAEGVGRC
jgi:hypothetical protein